MYRSIKFGDWNFVNGYYGYIIQVHLEREGSPKNGIHEPLELVRLSYPYSKSPYLERDGVKIADLPKMDNLDNLKQIAIEKIRSFFGFN